MICLSFIPPLVMLAWSLVVNTMPMLYPPLWLFLFVSVIGSSFLFLSGGKSCLDVFARIVNLISLFTLRMAFILAWNFRVHRILSPPCVKSFEYLLFPITLHKIVSFLLWNEQIANIFLGTWPTVVSSFTTITAKGSAVL